MFKISFDFEPESGLDAVDPLGDLILSDGRSEIVLKTTYLDSWLEALINAQRQTRTMQHVTAQAPEEPEPLTIATLPDARLSITHKGQTVVAETRETFETALRTASRSFLDAISALPGGEQNEILDTIRAFARAPEG